MTNVTSKFKDSLKPESFLDFVNYLKSTKNKEECLEVAYNYFINQYHGEKLKTYTNFLKLFQSDTKKLWLQKGFMHCTNINKLFFESLVESGHYKTADIKRKWTLIWFFSPHQYLRIKIDESKYMYVDIWAHQFGIKFGDYARGFHL